MDEILWIAPQIGIKSRTMVEGIDFLRNHEESHCARCACNKQQSLVIMLGSGVNWDASPVPFPSHTCVLCLL